MPKVSIIVPVYNVEDYLRECLESVVNQTLKEIEIICVNDGSTDNSLAILEEYADSDNRIIIINKQNGGLSSARNKGMSVAKGEYIYFLDSDDYIDLQAMKLLYNASKKNNLDVLYFNAEPFFETSELESRHGGYRKYYSRKSEYKKVLSGKELFKQMMKNGDYLPSACFQFIRNDYVKNINLCFYEGIIHEDNLFTFLCIIQASRVSHINKILFFRRVRGSSIMTQTEGIKNLKGYFICLCEVLRFLNDRHYGKEVMEAITENNISFYNHVKRIFRKLSDDKKDLIEWEGNAYYQSMFDILIKQAVWEKRQITNTQVSGSSHSKKNIITFLMFTLKKIYGFFKCCRDHGLKYTLQRFMNKLKRSGA